MEVLKFVYKFFDSLHTQDMMPILFLLSVGQIQWFTCNAENIAKVALWNSEQGFVKGTMTSTLLSQITYSEVHQLLGYKDIQEAPSRGLCNEHPKPLANIHAIEPFWKRCLQTQSHLDRKHIRNIARLYR